MASRRRTCTMNTDVIKIKSGKWQLCSLAEILSPHPWADKVVIKNNPPKSNSKCSPSLFCFSISFLSDRHFYYFSNGCSIDRVTLWTCLFLQMQFALFVQGNLWATPSVKNCPLKFAEPAALLRWEIICKKVSYSLHFYCNPNVLQCVLWKLALFGIGF